MHLQSYLYNSHCINVSNLHLRDLVLLHFSNNHLVLVNYYDKYVGILIARDIFVFVSYRSLENFRMDLFRCKIFSS